MKHGRIPTAINGKITLDSGWLELEMMEINLSAKAVFTVSDSINVRKFMVLQTSVQLLFSGRSFAATLELCVNMKSWLQQHDCFWLCLPRLGHRRTSVAWFCPHWCSSWTLMVLLVQLWLQHSSGGTDSKCPTMRLKPNGWGYFS